MGRARNEAQRFLSTSLKQSLHRKSYVLIIVLFLCAGVLDVATTFYGLSERGEWVDKSWVNSQGYTDTLHYRETVYSNSETRMFFVPFLATVICLFATGICFKLAKTRFNRVVAYGIVGLLSVMAWAPGICNLFML